jgi:hypothetical protein
VSELRKLRPFRVCGVPIFPVLALCWSGISRAETPFFITYTHQLEEPGSFETGLTRAETGKGDGGESTNSFRINKDLVGAARFELTTPCAQGRCATRLRYAPTFCWSLYSKPLLNSPRFASEESPSAHSDYRPKSSENLPLWPGGRFSFDDRSQRTPLRRLRAYTFAGMQIMEPARDPM